MKRSLGWLETRRSVALVAIGWSTLLLVSSAFAESDSQPAGLYVRDGTLMRQGRPYRGIGANYQTLFARLLNNKDDTSSIENLSLLSKAGIPFVRFRAAGGAARNSHGGEIRREL